MTKLHRESALVLIGSFIGAFFSVGVDKLIADWQNIWNWAGFIVFVIILFILTKYLLKPYVK